MSDISLIITILQDNVRFTLNAFLSSVRRM